MFEIEFGDQGELSLKGRLDAAEAERALEVLETLDASATADCSQLEYISSAGIGVIVETHKRLKERGHGLRLVGLNPRLKNVFKYAGLDKYLPIE